MKVFIKTTRQPFMVGGSVKVFINGVERVWLGNGDQETLEVEQGENNILIKSGIRQKNITFSSSQDVTVTVKWNRLSGGIEALINGSDVKVLDNK